MLLKNSNKKMGWILIFVSLMVSYVNAAIGSNWIEQWGITWTFDKNISTDGATGTYQYGQFANGDYWVVGPVNIVSINPSYAVVDSPTESGGTFPNRIINGSMLNPIPSNLQGYDSAASGWIQALCVNAGIKATSPLMIDTTGNVPVQSLVSTISVATVPSKVANPRLKTAAILTIIASTPAADAFRPPYAGNSKPAEIRKNDILWNTLKTLAPITSTPNIINSENVFARPWLEHKGPYPSSDIKPTDNMPDYGRNEARESGIAALLLNLNYTQVQKETLLLRFLQYGIDNYGIAICREYAQPGHPYRGHRIWYGAGGIGIGKRTAIVFAAKVFNHAGMIAALSKSGDYLWESVDANGYSDPYGPGIDNFPPDYIQFGEEQVFYVRRIHVDLTNNEAPAGWPGWSPDSRNEIMTPYSIEDIGLPEWGERASENPHTVNKHWVIGYRGIAGGPQVGSVLALRIMGAVDICNHDAWFDYYDRYMTFIQRTGYSYELNGVTITPFASDKPWRFGIDGVDLYNSSPFVWNMWNAYRANYGPVWPDTGSQPASYTLSINASNGSVTKSPNKTTYASGESVVLTAVANTGYSFNSWTGSVTGTSNPITVIMNSNKSVTANFIQNTGTTYTLSITSSNGTVTKSPDKTSYNSGETVALTATANNGYNFVNWTGDATGSINPVAIIMNANKTVTANFTSSTPVTMPTDTVYQNTNEITFNATNTYQSISTNGWNLNGTTITFWANPDNLTGRRFLLGHTVGEWSNRVQLSLNNTELRLGLGDTNARQTNLATLQTGQWYFVSLYWNGTNYTVQVNNQIVGTGTYTGLTIFNTSADIGNNGSPTSRTEPFSGIIDDVRIYGRTLSNAEVTAIYNSSRSTATPTTYTLSVTATNGTVTKSPDKTAYSSGETVILTATANTGYSFGSWTGDATGTTNPVTVTMNGNKAVTANFTQNTYTLSITATNGSVAKSPNTATYTYGQTVTLTATANAGYNFSSWTGDATGTTNPVTVTMNGNKTVTANFTMLSMAESMTAHWLLDENIGSSATDTVAGHIATLINNPSWGLAWRNEDWLRMNYASDTQAIVIPTSSILQPQAGTIAVWVEPENSGFIFGHVLNGVNRISLYSVSGNLALGLGSNAAQQINIAPLVTGQLVHIALTWNGTSFAVYVNAEQKTAGTFEGLTALNTTMDIGNYGDPANRTLGFAGVIEDVRTYNRALHATEIQNLYYTEDVHQRKSAVFEVQDYSPVTTTLPAGAKFESGVFSWKPWYNQTGDYQIRFTAVGQPDRIMTVSVHDVPLTDWYRQFLIYTGKLQ